MSYIHSKEFKDFNLAFLNILEESFKKPEQKESGEESVIKQNNGFVDKPTKEDLVNLIKRELATIELDSHLKEAVEIIYQLVLMFYPNADDEVDKSIVGKIYQLIKNIKNDAIQFATIKKLSGEK